MLRSPRRGSKRHDTNVLVSAMLKWDSVPSSIMELTFDGPIIPVLNAEILKEYREVLMRPKCHLTSKIVDSVLEGIERKGFFVEAEALDIELPDPKDRVFIRSSWRNARTMTPTL